MESPSGKEAESFAPSGFVQQPNPIVANALGLRFYLSPTIFGIGLPISGSIWTSVQQRLMFKYVFPLTGMYHVLLDIWDATITASFWHSFLPRLCQAMLMFHGWRYRPRFV